MRVLLTGGTGFVGRHVKAYLELYTDWEIVAPSANLTKPLPYCGKFDFIINLASASSVEQSVKQPAKFIQDNIAIATNVLEYAVKHRPELFLHFSTVEVYNITNPYAASKAAQEAIAEAYWKSFDVPLVIARSTNIVGPGQRPEKFVPKIIEQIKAGEPIQLYTSGGKQGKRVYNTAYNVADAIHFLLDHANSKALETKKDLNWEAPPVHWDIDGGTELTNLEMAQLVAGHLNMGLDYELIEPEKQRPTYAQSLRPSATKLTTVGWKPPQTLDEGMAWIQ